MQKIVALLRGINVGGHKKVPMKDLKKVLEKNGFSNVKTLLASGNVVFEAKEADAGKVSGIIEDKFGFSVPTILVPFIRIEEIVKSDPFEGITVTPKTRLYITFLAEKTDSNLEVPFTTEDGSFRIIRLEDQEVYSVLDLEKTGTLDGMKILETEFGKNVTSRNYNTVVKIAQL